MMGADTTVKHMVLSFVPSFLQKYTNRIEASPLGYRLAKGAFWSLIVGATISRGLTLVASIIVSVFHRGKRGLETGYYSKYGRHVWSFCGFGNGNDTTKHIAEFRETAPQKGRAYIALFFPSNPLPREEPWL